MGASGMARSRWRPPAIAVGFGLMLAAQPSASTGSPAGPLPPVIEPIFDSVHGLAPGWIDYGWAARALAPGRPAVLELDRRGAGWILGRPGLAGSFDAVTFRLKTTVPPEQFLEVFLDARNARSLPHVRIESRHRLGGEGGWTQLLVPLSELNPEVVAFDRIVFRAVGLAGTIEIDGIGLTGSHPPGTTTPTSISPEALAAMARVKELEGRIAQIERAGAESKAAAATPPVTTPTTKAAAIPTAAAPQPAAAAAPTAPTAEPTTPGMTVEASDPRLVRPVLVSKSRARYPPAALVVGAAGVVEVLVLIDESGRVVEANVVRAQPLKLGFEQAALDQVRSMQYRPGVRDGVPVKVRMPIVVNFTPRSR